MTRYHSEKNMHPTEKKEIGPPLWCQFDAKWYCRRYCMLLSDAEKQADDQALEAIWQENARENKRSPNRFFDEEWYLQHNGNVYQHVRPGGIFETGFQHYIDIGAKSCTPHWLFKEEDYFRKNPDLSYRKISSYGFLNSYDHYLKIGDKVGKKANRFFDPSLFIKECLKDNIDIDLNEGAFCQFLSLNNPLVSLVRTSWYFDPKWYISAYPEVNTLIERGIYAFPLQHYLCNNEPTRFDPNPYFSESYYLTLYPDIARAVDEGHFRNGYEHFLRSGLYERRRPRAEIELDLSLSQGKNAHFLIEHEVEDVFALYIKQKEENFSIKPASCSIEEAKLLSIKRIAALLPSLYREPLCFTKTSLPQLSVIIISEGDYLSTIATLASLYHNFTGKEEIIVVSNGNPTEKALLKQAFHGVRLIYPSEWQNDKALFNIGLEKSNADNIVMLYNGVTFHSGAISIILSALENDEIDGGGGQVISSKHSVIEAGCYITRDSAVTVNGLGEKPFAPKLNFRRRADAFQRGVFFGRKHDLQPILAKISSLIDKTGFLTLSATLSALGKKLVYIPELLVNDLEMSQISFPRTQSLPLHFRQDFASYLVTKPLNIEQEIAVNVQQSGKKALLIYPRLPLKKEGGHSRRVFDLIKILCQNNWSVVFVALNDGNEDRLTIFSDFPQNVSCYIGKNYVDEFLEQEKAPFDLVWVNGADTLTLLAPQLKSKISPTQALILDIASLEGNGLKASETYLRRCVGAEYDKQRLYEELRRELSEAWICQAILTDNKWEADLIKPLGISNVLAVPNVYHDTLSSSLNSEKKGLLFPVPLLASGDAAHDGIDWFCLHVIPHLKELLPEEIPIWIGGYHHPSVNLEFYERFAWLRGLTKFVSFEDQLAQSQLMIVPTRVMNTVPPEILDAIKAGLPGVMGSSIMKCLEFEDGKTCLDGGFNDPQHFALAIAELYTNDTLWKEISQTASNKIAETHSLKQFETAILNIIEPSSNRIHFDHKSNLVQNEKKRRFKPAPLFLTVKSKSEEKIESSLLEIEEENNPDIAPKIRLGVSLNT
ncbi:hypothetical protein GT348_03900 [Aristophania vespae]|uniref:Glycosyltransferase n=1 Tax=Aristophania vespae TaxID=2697033 RepID=A0A6P1NDI2_9PROT|nr:hypothetical protein [Aristophania vespae]QHI95523.1 hypothetical protein GT348_03900 [Aristophania vespae]